MNDTSATELPAFDPSEELNSLAAASTATGLIPQIGDGSTTSLKSRHMILIDALITWMLFNPGVKLSKAAKVNGGPFDLSVLWLRQVASADAFKARLAQKQQDVDVLLTIPTLKDKLAAVTEAAVDRLGEMLPVATDPEFVKDSTEMLLEQHYKIGIPKEQNSGGVHIHMDGATLAIVDARKRILEGKVLPAATEAQVVQEQTQTKES